MNFNKAYKNLIKHEGGYENNPIDKGGETYKGISRKYHPQWKGWDIIDSIKKNINNKEKLNKSLLETKELEQLVLNFYKTKYWDKFKGDSLPYEIAEELLEQSVVLGSWKTAGKQLQIALNYLNRNGKLFKKLKVDGLVGPKTLGNIPKVNKRRLLKVLNGLEFCRFKESMDNNNINKIFVGWFDRV